ncbi:MAG: response regulator [Elusimicrobiaceae bacterium]
MKRQLLIVDDEKYILDLLCETFKSDNIEVFCAKDGKEALDYVSAHGVDVVVTDIVMPNLNGLQLFYEIRKKNPFAQIIIITGYPSIQNMAEMFEAGASDFLVKPFDLDVLKNVVTETFVRVERWYALRETWLEHREHKPE